MKKKALKKMYTCMNIYWTATKRKKAQLPVTKFYQWLYTFATCKHLPVTKLQGSTLSEALHLRHLQTFATHPVTGIYSISDLRPLPSADTCQSPNYRYLLYQWLYTFTTHRHLPVTKLQVSNPSVALHICHLQTLANHQIKGIYSVSGIQAPIH